MPLRYHATATADRYARRPNSPTTRTAPSPAATPRWSTSRAYARTGGTRAQRRRRADRCRRRSGPSPSWSVGIATLRLSGVPLKAKPDVVQGGIGGGVGEKINVGDSAPVAGVNSFLGRMRELLLLNGGVLIVILFGMAGVAFLIRRRV